MSTNYITQMLNGQIPKMAKMTQEEIENLNQFITKRLNQQFESSHEKKKKKKSPGPEFALLANSTEHLNN